MYTPKQKNIYRFNDGTRNRVVDPLKVYRKLLTYPDFSLEVDTKLIATGRPEGLEALERLAQATRAAFGIKEFTEKEDGSVEGMTDDDLVGLLLDFAGFVEAVKKNTEESQTSPNATAQPSLEQTSPTNVTSVSG